MVLFATHDLLRDAAFSLMELISCRNLLIYLNRDAQQRVFETFHFALKPGGLLFLGSSESVDDESPLFRVLDKKTSNLRAASLRRIGTAGAVASASLSEGDCPAGSVCWARGAWQALWIECRVSGPRTNGSGSGSSRVD